MLPKLRHPYIAIVLLFVIFPVYFYFKGEGPGGAHNTKPASTLTIYYIWTTNPESYVHLHRRCLESALFHHPNASFRIYSHTLPQDFFAQYADLGYDISIRELDYDTYFKGTRMESLVPKVKSSPYASAHLADLLRMYLLWKDGGLYLDADVFVLKNFDELCKVMPMQGAIGLQEEGSYNNAILCFPEPGHPFWQSVMKGALEGYNPNEWTSIGPGLMSRSVGGYDKSLHIRSLPTPQMSVTQLLKEARYHYFFNSPRSLSKSLESQGLLVVLDRVEYFYPRHWSQSTSDAQQPINDSQVDPGLWSTITNQSFAHHIATHFWPEELKSGSTSIPETSLLGRILKLIPEFQVPK